MEFCLSVDLEYNLMSLWLSLRCVPLFYRILGLSSATLSELELCILPLPPADLFGTDGWCVEFHC